MKRPDRCQRGYLQNHPGVRRACEGHERCPAEPVVDNMFVPLVIPHPLGGAVIGYVPGGEGSTI